MAHIQSKAYPPNSIRATSPRTPNSIPIIFLDRSLDVLARASGDRESRSRRAAEQLGQNEQSEQSEQSGGERAIGGHVDFRYVAHETLLATENRVAANGNQTRSSRIRRRASTVRSSRSGLMMDDDDDDDENDEE